MDNNEVIDYSEFLNTIMITREAQLQTDLKKAFDMYDTVKII